MKKTLTLSVLAATILGGMMLTLPAEAYGYHHEWRHPVYVSNYNPYFSGYQTVVPVPIWHRVRTGWYR